MSLTELISVIPPDAEDEPEDIFAAAPGLIFTDDLRTNHGDEGEVLIYKSREFGNIELRTARFESETDRKLFAHYLWNAGIKMAELISSDNATWNVKDETVLELGAGVGLDGIVAALAGAQVVGDGKGRVFLAEHQTLIQYKVTITDYPTEALLENIRKNASKAIPAELETRYHVHGYEWGDVESQFALANARKYSRIIAADCFWMPHEHENLVRSMLHLLSESPDAMILAIAGFHTGRAKLAGFFREAVAQRLRVEEIYEEDHEGHRREWAEERDGGTENVTERKKWLVVARLKRCTT